MGQKERVNDINRNDTVACERWNAGSANVLYVC
nr:MAG TPA: hypothetical protein [Caudoviricetes sp.]